MRTVVIYHRKCIDGIIAAWTVLNKYARDKSETTTDFVRSVENDIDTIAVDYQVVDESIIEICREANVFIVDFSFLPEMLNRLAIVANSIVVIDHHKSAINKLEGYTNDKVTLVLDINKSGAGLTWEYFNKDLPLPTLLQLAQDYDLWIHQYPQSKAVVRGLYHLDVAGEENWGLLDQLAVSDDALISIIELGNTIIESEIKYIESVARDSLTIVKFMGYKVPLLPVHHKLASIAGELLNNTESFPFAITYDYVNPEANFPHGYIRLSLRSRKDGGADLFPIVTPFGGGGQGSAAGIKVDRNNFKYIDEFINMNTDGFVMK